MKAIMDFLKTNWLILLIIVSVVITVTFFGKRVKQWFFSLGILSPSPDDKYNYTAYLQHRSMFSLGTDEKTLFKSLEGLSPLELVKVFKAFGERRYLLKGRYYYGLYGSNLNLIQWYNAELSGSDLGKMKIIWSSTGLFEKFSE